MTNSATSPPSTSKLFLLVAIALGILAMVLAFVLLQTGANANRGPKLSIVVAKHDISPNMALDPDRDLKVIDIPTDFAPMARGTLAWDARANYKGQRVNRDIFTGQPVMLGDFSGVGDLSLDEPYRALTIPADTGMIIPGDRVKIILGKLGAPNPTGPMVYDSTILGPKDPKQSGYKVLAVGGYLFKTRSQVTASDQAGSNSGGQRTVTLQVTEPEAKEIIGALNGVGNGQKATLLICPSDLTRTAETKP